MGQPPEGYLLAAPRQGATPDIEVAVVNHSHVVWKSSPGSTAIPWVPLLSADAPPCGLGGGGVG